MLYMCQRLLDLPFTVLYYNRRYASLVNDEYVFNELDIVNRDDELMNYSAALNYQARRWLKFSTFYQYTDRDSNRDTIGYDKSEVGLTVEVTL